jgi:hypothetical protein
VSLYNMLFGVNASAPVLLAMLGIDSGDVPRFRDCFLSEDRKQIIIHTRTGGGNRDDYEDGNTFMQGLPGYQHDEDDDFDCTYANFHYAVPEKFAHLIDKLPEGVDPAKRWQETIENLKTATPDDPQVKKLGEVLSPMLEALKKGEGGTFTV